MPGPWLAAARRARTLRTLFLYASLAAAAVLGPVSAARAVVNGTSSALGAHVVRIHAGHYCSGVAIARRKIVTARHCVSSRMRIVAGGMSIGIARVSTGAVLDDGRRVSVSGDAAIVRLSAPLPASVVPASVGEGYGDSYTIAGYGTASERSRGAFGTLREAHLVAAEPRALVDPHREGSIGASACFGDSGGPVLRGSALIGIVTRAAHPHPRIACGHLTRWAPIVVSGTASETTGAAGETTGAATNPQIESARPYRRTARIRGAPVKRVQQAIYESIHDRLE